METNEILITGMMDNLDVNIREDFEDTDDLPNVTMLDKPFETKDLLSSVKELMSKTMDV